MKQWLAIICLLPITYVTGYNVLMMLPFSSPSHKNAFDPVADELVQRGHKVTIMVPFKVKNSHPGVTVVHLKDADTTFNLNSISFFTDTPAGFTFFTKMTTLLAELCNATLRDPVVSELLANPRNDQGKPQYDLVVIDSIFGDFALPVAYRLGVPAMFLSPGNILPYQAWSLNIPCPFSYVPVGISFTSKIMTFKERVLNTFQGLSFNLIRRIWIVPKQDEIIQEILPSTPSLLELERNVSFMLVNTHPALHGASPKMPYVAEIGGINCKPAKPLPKDLEDFMVSSGEHGVVYFSLGSHTKGESMPEEMKRKILEVFSKLPQKVLWKYEGQMDGLSSNIRLISWAPQQDLLAHPKMKLFITHGGLMSTHESACHGCPILVFPLSADQWGNAARAFDVEFSEFLNWKTFTSQELLDKIQKLISNPRYKRRALELSKLYHDRPQHPAETAAYWMEYVIRHKGAVHLKSSADQLNFFQYFLLDVFAVIFLVFFILVFTAWWLLHRILTWCRGQPKKLKKN